MNDDVIAKLNSLIETSKDGEKGFRDCAEHAKSSSLKSVFESRAQGCAQAAAELQAIVTRLGGDAKTSGSATAAMHRGWMDVKAALGGGDLAMLEECERGEDNALKSYREAIRTSYPDDIAQVVQRQYEGAKRNHDQIRTLRDQMKAQKSS